MRCQYCNCAESKVIDSRPTEEGNSIRRRRECMGCGRRFTTYEKIEMLPLMVVKRDGRRETFDAQSLFAPSTFREEPTFSPHPAASAAPA